MLAEPRTRTPRRRGDALRRLRGGCLVAAPWVAGAWTGLCLAVLLGVWGWL